MNERAFALYSLVDRLETGFHQLILAVTGGLRIIPAAASVATRATVLLLSIALIGCGSKSERAKNPHVAATNGGVRPETAIVQVGSTTITAADILEQMSRLPPREPSENGIDERKRRIEPIIQARLLLIEAEARGLEDEALRRRLRRMEREALVTTLERVEIRERIEANPPDVAGGDEDSLIAAEFSRRQIAFLDTMKARLHFTILDSTLSIFLSRMQGWEGEDTVGTIDSGDRFGFSAVERAQAIFTYDGGQFTIGDYAEYLSAEPATRVRQRSDRGRVERDLDLYFRHHAYADVARSRGYLALTGVAAEIKRFREQALIEKLYEAEITATSSGEENETREQAYQDFIARLKARYPITYHEEALLRLPL